MYDKPIFWEQGLFLHPQHFQLATVQQEWHQAAMAHQLMPFLWGLQRCTINESILNNGVFELTELELLLPSGERLYLGENTTLPARSFQDIWDKPDLPLDVWLGLAPFSFTGGNVHKTDSPENAPENCRFTAPLSPDEIPDLFGSGPRAEVCTLRYNLRLCFGPHEGSDLQRLPLTRLLRDGDRVYLDTQFAPPCVNIHTSNSLRVLLRDVRDTLISRCKQLEEYKIVGGDLSSNAGISNLQGLLLFSVLGALSRHVPRLHLMLQAPQWHPWQAYISLCELVGELSVFSASLSPLGETSQGVKALPDYNHEDPFPCFSAAASIIARLVNTLVIGPDYTFPLEERRGCLGTIMPQSACSNSHAYWLLLRSAEWKELPMLVQHYAKLAPAADMPAIVARALPGIRLTGVDQPPAGLPRRGDTQYFRIDQTDPLWQKVLETGEIAFLLPDAPADMTAQLTIIQR